MGRPQRLRAGGKGAEILGAIVILLIIAVGANQYFGPWVDLGALVPEVATGAPNTPAPQPPPPPPEPQQPAAPPGPLPRDHDPEVARIICSVARELGANNKVLLSAYEAALVESSARNLNYGDRDSLGVFQQRPSQGWGTPAQIMDVRYASRQYLTRAIASDRGNPGFTPGNLAQSVQRSGFPDRYDQRERPARALIAAYCS